jgi:hypothetical protein
MIAIGLRTVDLAVSVSTILDEVSTIQVHRQSSVHAIAHVSVRLPR